MALSIKQPWATLVLCGLKTIEVRRWSTKRTGLIYIHAGRHPDRREEAWSLVPDSFHDLAQLRGGLVGRSELVGCRRYTSSEEFACDCQRHHNAPEWFVPPVMYGFELANAEPIPFRTLRGNLYFFPVSVEE